jgi:hypothetical protein
VRGPSTLSRLAERPGERVDFAAWFARVAETLLNHCDFLVNGTPFRIAELEMYYHGDGHRDPFAHAHPLQRQAGKWYFHRTGNSYRGGTFKGLDLSLGDGAATFGLLFRTIVDPNGEAISGPSRIVDYLLKLSGCTSVKELDGLIGERSAWDVKSPLVIRESKSLRTATMFATARVGLTLKRLASHPEMPGFLSRPYRFLTEPRLVRKGRRELVIALHRQGLDAAAIHALTGVPRRVIGRYLV